MKHTLLQKLVPPLLLMHPEKGMGLAALPWGPGVSRFGVRDEVNSQRRHTPQECPSLLVQHMSDRSQCGCLPDFSCHRTGKSRSRLALGPLPARVRSSLKSQLRGSLGCSTVSSGTAPCLPDGWLLLAPFPASGYIHNAARPLHTEEKSCSSRHGEMKKCPTHNCYCKQPLPK